MQRTRINYEEGQPATSLRSPSKVEEAQEETETVLKGNRFAILATEGKQVFSRRVRVVSPCEGDQQGRRV